MSDDAATYSAIAAVVSAGCAFCTGVLAFWANEESNKSAERFLNLTQDIKRAIESGSISLRSQADLAAEKHRLDGHDKIQHGSGKF